MTKKCNLQICIAIPAVGTYPTGSRQLTLYHSTGYRSGNPSEKTLRPAYPGTKNIRGSWSITGVGARLAGKGSITTHVPRGGSVEDPFKLLSSLFGPEDSTDLLNKVKSTAIQIARQIERASGLSHGEMSMDLGVDTLGTLWFFEANAKPMKFDEPEIRQKSLRRIFQYSSFLAGRMKS